MPRGANFSKLRSFSLLWPKDPADPGDTEPWLHLSYATAVGIGPSSGKNMWPFLLDDLWERPGGVLEMKAEPRQRLFSQKARITEKVASVPAEQAFRCF